MIEGMLLVWLISLL